MATTTPCSSNIPNRPTYSCIRCAERKVKCDRKVPCSACVRHSVECVFKSSQPPRNRHRRLNTQVLTDRLRHYEALLREKGIDPNKLQHSHVPEARHRSSHSVPAPNSLQLRIPPSIESEISESSRSAKKAHAIQGQGHLKYVDNILWTRLVEELHDPQDAIKDFPDDASDSEGSDNKFGFILGSQRRSDTKSRHPAPEGIHTLWQIFIVNIDPLTKIVHVPTLQPAIEKAATNIRDVPRSFEALMFAIYSAAVMSLTDDECKQRLCEPRKVLLLRYISATKDALSRAKFMGNANLIVLQALIIHLLAVRDIYEPRAVWSLTGVAVRIAQSLGLERDGVYLGLPPFETEMRRRIWWQLKMHDFRTAELCGIAKFQDLHTGAESTKWPTNINDDQLYPDMPSLVDESKGLTDAVFISLKCELLNYAAERAAKSRQKGENSSRSDLYTLGSDTAEIDNSLNEIEELLETKYLRYCDPSQPLHLMAMLFARCSIHIVRFLSRHPRRWASIEQTPAPERQWVWNVCIKLLEQHNMLQSNPQLKQFAWHAPYFQQWHAIIHVLDTLLADPLTADAEKAWKLIGNTYKNNPEMAYDMRKPIHVAVGNLCLKAYDKREAAQQNGNARPPPVPNFIVHLRQQREAVKAKRQERHAKSTQPGDLFRNDQEKARNNNPRPRSRSISDTGIEDLGLAAESAYLKPSTASPTPDLAQSSGTPVPPERDPFWFTYGLNDGQAGDVSDANIDLDSILDQNYGVEDSANHTIPWDQWDTWLADSNVMRPL
ncbi:fungal-specific transcription factor domain-containing protein [Whalleya microplaca]|nr:fungal-specific transcription factor domain-containing protein [Whalleya microplaca]